MLDSNEGLVLSTPPGTMIYSQSNKRSSSLSFWRCCECGIIQCDTQFARVDHETSQSVVYDQDNWTDEWNTCNSGRFGIPRIIDYLRVRVGVLRYLEKVFTSAKYNL